MRIVKLLFNKFYLFASCEVKNILIIIIISFLNTPFMSHRVYNIDKRLEPLIYKLLINNIKYLINEKIIILFIFIIIVAFFIYKTFLLVLKIFDNISIRFLSFF